MCGGKGNVPAADKVTGSAEKPVLEQLAVETAGIQAQPGAKVKSSDNGVGLFQTPASPAEAFGGLYTINQQVSGQHVSITYYVPALF